MEKIPFIRFLWVDSEGKHRVYDTDYPTQFISEFTDTKVTEVGGFLYVEYHKKLILWMMLLRYVKVN